MSKWKEGGGRRSRRKKRKEERRDEEMRRKMRRRRKERLCEEPSPQKTPETVQPGHVLSHTATDE